MSRRKIKFSLTEDSSEKAIRELDQYKKEFSRKVEIFRQKVAERIADEAQSGFNGAVVDDIAQGNPRMADVKVRTDERGSLSVIIADGEDAVWVEFGAGVYHNGAAGSSPHPHGAELGFTIGSFDKGNGKRKVWGFYEDGNLVLTHGTPAAMPMNRAVITVCNEIADVAKEVFG